MASISIETKKVSELTALTTPANANLIPIHDGSALKKITFQNLQTAMLAPVREEVSPLLYNNAGAHNAIYRGKNLGTGVTAAQWAAIAAGTGFLTGVGVYLSKPNVAAVIDGLDVADPPVEIPPWIEA